MPKNIVIDLNVILDVLLERHGFRASLDVLQLSESDEYRLYMSAHIVTTLAYLLESAKVPRAEITRQIGWLLLTFTVVATDSELLAAAQKSRLTDFEDAVIEQAAVACKASVIVTRNTKDFKTSLVSAVTPEDYIGNIRGN